jgi:hypothetical protein
MESSAKQTWYRRAGAFLWQQGLIYFYCLALSFFIPWLVAKWRATPSGAFHPTELLATGAILFASLAGGLSLAKAATLGVRRIKRWHNPISLALTAHGGKVAAVEVQYSGIPTTWEARMRILKVAGTVFNQNPRNPDPLLRQCFFEKDGIQYRALPLMDGDTASIVLAEIKYSHYLSSSHETWVAVPNADDARVSGNTTIELNLSTKPIQKKLSIKRCFKVSRIGNDTMECTEAPCE